MFNVCTCSMHVLCVHMYVHVHAHVVHVHALVYVHLYIVYVHRHVQASAMVVLANRHPPGVANPSAVGQLRVRCCRSAHMAPPATARTHGTVPSTATTRFQRITSRLSSVPGLTMVRHKRKPVPCPTPPDAVPPPAEQARTHLPSVCKRVFLVSSHSQADHPSKP